MTMGLQCFYCAKDERLHDLMIEIGPLQASTLYLFKEQTYYGRCVLAFKRHVKELTLLSSEELAFFMQDVSRTAAALQKAFAPDNINFGIYNDTGTHLHFHVVPKYQGKASWGSTFEMMPSSKKMLSPEEYQQMIAQIMKFL